MAATWPLVAASGAALIVATVRAGEPAPASIRTLYLALQLKARQEGIATPVYAQQPSHHPS